MNALLRRPGLTKKSTVVDIGAGTGQFTLAVAPVCARVIAVDVSPVMLDLLRGKVGRRHSTTSTSSTPAFYEHAGEPADIIYSRYALHHLPDMWKASALTRLRSILRPEGLLRLLTRRGK